MELYFATLTFFFFTLDAMPQKPINILTLTACVDGCVAGSVFLETE